MGQITRSWTKDNPSRPEDPGRLGRVLPFRSHGGVLDGGDGPPLFPSLRVPR